MAKAHVLLPLGAAAVAVMMSVAVVASLAAAAPVSGNGAMMANSPAVVAEAPPPLMAARGNRVDDEEPGEMDSEAHRRLAVLARRGYRPPHLSYGTLNYNKAACNPFCSKRGEPYFPNHCNKKYHFPS